MNTLVIPVRAALSSAALFSAAATATADNLYGFVQITCAPEIGYFSIRKFQIYNLPHKGPFLTEGLSPGRSPIATLQQGAGKFVGNFSHLNADQRVAEARPAFRRSPGRQIHHEVLVEAIVRVVRDGRS
jgi:hypothetical protein